MQKRRGRAFARATPQSNGQSDCSADCNMKWRYWQASDPAQEIPNALCRVPSSAHFPKSALPSPHPRGSIRSPDSKSADGEAPSSPTIGERTVIGARPMTSWSIPQRVEVVLVEEVAERPVPDVVQEARRSASSPRRARAMGDSRLDVGASGSRCASTRRPGASRRARVGSASARRSRTPTTRSAAGGCGAAAGATPSRRGPARPASPGTPPGPPLVIRR